MILKQAALPEDIVALGEEKVNQIWRDAKLRANVPADTDGGKTAGD